MIEINNLTRFKIDKNFAERIVKNILKNEKKIKTDLSIAFTGSAEIQKLNKKYRKINKPTDVLSFGYKGGGEILICPQIVKKNAKEYKEAFQKEFYRVLVHGVLHILGYTHKEKDDKMIKKQESYLSKLLKY